MRIITLNKRIAIFCLSFILVAISFVIAIGTAFNPTVASNGMVVVVDAGHGGRDGGVTGVSTGIAESVINLAISKSLKHFLREAGYTVVMTRENNNGLYGNVSSGFKKADMSARRDIINKARPNLVISIHQNSYPNKSTRGAQVFYAPTTGTSTDYADNMQRVLNGSLAATNRTAKSGDYYILQCTEYNSILIECGFLSNAEDEQLLSQPEYQEKVAFSICVGVRLILEK